MKTHEATQSELPGLRTEFRREITAVRHQIHMIELSRQLKKQTAATKAVWKRGLQVYFAGLLVNILGIIGVFYWFAKLLGH